MLLKSLNPQKLLLERHFFSGFITQISFWEKQFFINLKKNFLLTCDENKYLLLSGIARMVGLGWMWTLQIPSSSLSKQHHPEGRSAKENIQKITL